MNDKIFISMASYRDPELLPTIYDCIKQANNPKDLVFCIAWQHSTDDDWDNLDDYKNDPRFHIIDIDYKDSLGTCWARHLIQQKYNGEAYTLQLDSHHRFSKGWDTKLKDMVKQLQDAGYKKPILTSYIPSYDPQNDPRARVKEVWKLDFDRFTPEGVIFMLPATMTDAEEQTMPVPTRFFSAHFAFTLGQFNKEVPYDPNLYFHGEEITMAVRAYTHGYDLFTPHKTVAWHEYTRNGRVRHWDENSKWDQLNKASLRRCKSLLGVDGVEPMDFGEYGFGTERTKEDYEKYAGIRFKDRAVQKYTFALLEAPNPTYSTPEAYEKSFIRKFRHCIDIWKPDIEDLDWDGWVVSFENEKNEEMFRLDADKEEIEQIKNANKGDFYNIWREFETTEIPHHSVVWPFKHGVGWGRKLEVKVPTL